MFHKALGTETEGTARQVEVGSHKQPGRRINESLQVCYWRQLPLVMRPGTQQPTSAMTYKLGND